MDWVQSIISKLNTIITNLGTNQTGLQIKPKTIDLHQAASSYTVFTGTTHDVLVKNLVFRAPTGGVSGGTITGISVQTDDATPTVFIPQLQGVIANLLTEQCLSWASFGEAILLKAGKHIQVTIYGGATGAATVCDIVAEYEACVPGGYLA